MPLFSKLLAAGKPNQPAEVHSLPPVNALLPENGKDAGLKSTLQLSVPDEEAQHGVQQMEAVALIWTKWSLAAMLVCIWILFLTNGFRIAILYNLTPYVTSDFQSHSLLTVIDVVAAAMAGAVYIPMAKMMDVWGRAEGFLLMAGFSILGLILMAVSDNLEIFCAAQIFYSIGFAGLIYSIVVLAADVTNLKNRGLAFAFTSSPYMITAFAGSKAAEGFLLQVNWRWGFGAFAIIIPFVTLPIYSILKVNERKARKQGIWEERTSSGRPALQTLKYIIFEYDFIGVLLFAAGLIVFLLPFTIASRAPRGWKTDYIIAMIVVGFATICFFTVYQVYLAPKPFLKHEFLTNRTVIAACLIDATYQMAYYCWNSYFTSFLQVVYNLSVSNAGYVGSTFQVVSGVNLFIIGYAIRRTGRFKWMFYWATPLYILAQGLMIYFRRPDQSVGYIIMCEILISIAGSAFILCVQLAVLAVVDHQHFAAVLTVLFVSGSIGGSVGSAISGAIWTNTFAPALEQYLPESALPNLFNIVSSLPVQLSYAEGTLERRAIQEAYGYAQTRMLAAGTGIMALCFIWTLLLEDVRVNKTQLKGRVF